MKTLVLLAGIADPKWPLPRELAVDGLLRHQAAHQVLGPFDEAALELALKLRDADPGVAVEAIVMGSEELARKVAGFRLDALLRLDASALPLWSAAELAAALPPLIEAPFDLLLVGREFGDADDGSLPAQLAQRLGIAHVSLALSMVRSEAGLGIVRQGAESLQRLAAGTPLVASVTNDSHNRLRQPLLKNVMAARRMAIRSVAPEAPAARITIDAVEATLAPVRAAACRFIGGTIEEQADELAGLLAALGEGA